MESNFGTFDVQAVEENPTKQLQQAIAKGEWAAVSPLVEHGADLYAQDVCGYASLHLAVLQGHPKITSMILAKGANKKLPRQCDLPIAARHDNLELVKVLMDKDAELSEPEGSVWRPEEIGLITKYIFREEGMVQP